MTTGITGFEPRVDFVVGGVQKGGTTSLDRLLRTHPAVGMASVKEPHWFDTDERFASGTCDYAPYHALWGAQPASRLCGDATPSYVWWPEAARRIRHYNPDMRWVLLLRDPAGRAYSHWNMQRERGNEPLAFPAALDAEEERLRTSAPQDVRRHSYVSRGYYARQLERLWSLFPKEQTLVLMSGQLRETPVETAESIAEFLGIEPFSSAEAISENEGTYAEPMSPRDRERLVRLYEPDIRAVERMLGWDLSAWLR